MSDLYGATSLPVSVTVGKASISDPALDVIGAFCQSVLTAEVNTAWSAFAPTETICRACYTHEPQKGLLSASFLPAIFLWRNGLTPSRWTDGTHGMESTLSLLWVFPPARSIERERHQTIVAGLAMALDKAFNGEEGNGRHPSWKVPLDPDPFAATYGSSILTWGGLTWIELGKGHMSEVQVDGSETPFSGVHFELVMREDFKRGAAGVYPAKVSTTLISGGQSQEIVRPI